MPQEIKESKSEKPPDDGFLLSRYPPLGHIEQPIRSLL